jgi:AcrR family transcriptional regulator
MSAATSPRLASPERRAAIIEAALRVFADGSYRGVTTAEIAKAAGISEPILYRHFASKRDLYLAAIEHLWQKVRTYWDDIGAGEADLRSLLETLGKRNLDPNGPKFLLSQLWVQALGEAGEDPELRRFLRAHLREVHDTIARGMRRAQEEGAIDPRRDIEAEAWISLTGSMVGCIARRIGLLHDEDIQRIRTLDWLTGETGEAR